MNGFANERGLRPNGLCQRTDRAQRTDREQVKSLEARLSEAKDLLHCVQQRAVTDRQSALFAALLYSSEESRWEDALEIGTEAFRTGHLDTSHTYEGFSACSAFASNSGNVEWSSKPSERKMLTQLFHLIRNSCGGDELWAKENGEGWTPLLSAVDNGSEVAAELIASLPTFIGADQRHDECGGRTAMMLAIDNGYVNVVENLSIHHYFEIDLYLADDEGRTIVDRMNSLPNRMCFGPNPDRIKTLLAELRGSVRCYRAQVPVLIETILHDYGVFAGCIVFPKELARLVVAYVQASAQS